MSRQRSIEQTLSAALQPLHLEVINESRMHNVPAGSESHFKLVVVSAQFEGESLVKRHRRVNALLQEQLASGLHAISMHTMTPEEWFERGGEVAPSPECMGGSKTEQR